MRATTPTQWRIKQMVFYLLRLRQPIRLIEAHPASGSEQPLRVLQIGQEARARDYLERLFGDVPRAKSLGGMFLPASPEACEFETIERDLDMIEINRLHLERFCSRGFFAIPQWVEFGCPVIAKEEDRYAGADQWLRQAIRGVKSSGFVPRITHEPESFRLFYDRMYLPHVHSRYRDNSIVKSFKKLRREFRSGFVLLLEREGEPLAGGVVRVSGATVALTAIGVVDGDERLLRQHASAALDYHLHAWAADQGFDFIDVGHTRPFPEDGVFFNKRKWRMSVRPDADGVMNLALRWRRSDPSILAALRDYSFIFQTRSGLGVFAIHPVEHALDCDEARKAIRTHWTAGLRSLVLVCPGGLRDGVLSRLLEDFEGDLRVCVDLESAQRTQARLT